MVRRLLILILIFNVKCQFEGFRPVPERCYGSAELVNRQCCIFPPFFKREVARYCGATFEVTLNTNNVTGLRRQASDSCEHWKCMLTKYGILDAEETVNDEKYTTHLDRWVDLNPEFSNVMSNAKMHCKQLYRLFLPLKVCEFRIYQSCIRNYINLYCPNMISTLECNEVREFYQECREYYV